MLFIAIGGLLAFGIASVMIVAIMGRWDDDQEPMSQPTLYPDPRPGTQDLSRES